jgi:O-succinylbenzoic acid--CoA ligase
MTTLSVLDAARECPERIALVIAGMPVTFGELGARAGFRLARLASSRLLPDGEGLVALVGASDHATLETVHALLAAGRPMALLHPRLTEAERNTAIALLAPRSVLVRDALVAAGAPGDDRAVEPAPVGDEVCLAVLMTSGTTGTPKGVVLSRRAFLASARGSEKNLPLAGDDRWLLGLPIAHVGGLSILTRCLVARAAVVVPEEIAAGQRLDENALVRSIERDRVTLVSLVPTQLEWLVARTPAWKPPSHLRAILLGGAAARPRLLERALELGLPVLTTYGLTEACSQVTTQRPGTVNRGQLGAGVPIDGVEVRIREGVIDVRGPTLFDGYLPVSVEPPLTFDGWFSTNDLGRLDPAGNLHVLGRRSDLIITGGENVHPAEVEAVVEQCPGIDAACVFGVPDDTWGEVVAVAYVAAPRGAPTDEALAAFVGAGLSRHRRPRLVARLTALAVTPAGKLDRPATRARALPELRKL